MLRLRYVGDAKGTLLRGCPKTQFFKKTSDFLRTNFAKKASKKSFRRLFVNKRENLLKL
jgi:hypothetical protein